MFRAWKSIKISILLLILTYLGGRSNVRPTTHYSIFHENVPWHLVVETVIAPSKFHKNKRRGKDRYTFQRYMKSRTIEVHAKVDKEGVAWVINAFEEKK